MEEHEDTKIQMVLSLFYFLFSVCVVYPPTEFVSAGFTINQLFDNLLGSENMNFVGYHIKRTALTAFIHCLLPLGYIFCLFIGGIRTEWMLTAGFVSTVLPFIFIYKWACWNENNKVKHPVVKCLLPYATPGSDWRLVAANLNAEFRSVDKVIMPLSTTSSFVATENWLIKVTPYKVYAVKQEDCILVATAVDTPNLNTTGEDDVQYLNIEAIPNRDNIEKFSFRLSSNALRELQPRLLRPVRVPEHISLLPTLIERFVKVFKEHVEQNPAISIEQELELCIGCMQVQADVKIQQRCLTMDNNNPNRPTCQQCNCRVLWCAACMARWWATRAPGPPSEWLSGQCTCPVCRAVFCLLDVAPVSPTSTS